MAREFQLIGYLRLLADNDVDCLLVGGVGARIQGTATTTQDIDIMPEPSVQNRKRLAKALSDEETEKKDAVDTAYRPHAVIDSTEFGTSDVSSYRTRFGVIDVLMELPGVGTFDAVLPNARRYQWEDHHHLRRIDRRHHHLEGDCRSSEGSPRARRAIRSARPSAGAPRPLRTIGAGSRP